MSQPFSRRRASVAAILTAACAAALVSSAQAETWNLGVGGSWSTATNWNPNTVPNGIDATITFNSLASGSNPAQTANRSITIDGTKTVGTIFFNTDDNVGNFTNAIATGSGGPLVFDRTVGPAQIITTGSGTGGNTISVAMTLTDSLVGIVTDTAASAGSGSLNLTGTMSGPGGFTKEGDGLATFGTGAKNYTGDTILNGGRIRISLAARPQQTSSFTINAGAQLTIIATSGTYNFGTGPLNLNGSGATSGPFAAFPGAIRNDTNLAVAITNNVVLLSNTLLHVQGAATGSLTFNGIVSGIGQLSLTAPNSNEDLGKLVLTADNSYSGGTLVRGGLLSLTGATADLGTGDVQILSAGLALSNPIASARLQIQTGTLNAISDTATLSLAGGKLPGLADDGFVELQAGINEFVGSLILGGATQIPGTYGAVGSGATFQDNEYFSGSGILTVIPEPASGAMLLGGLAALLGLRRTRKK